MQCGETDVSETDVSGGLTMKFYDRQKEIGLLNEIAAKNELDKSAV